MSFWKFLIGTVLLVVGMACQRPQTNTWSQRVDQALGQRLRDLPADALTGYQAGFTNGATMVHEALKAGVRPYRPVPDLPAPPPKWRGPVPEGVYIIDEMKMATEVDYSTGLLLHTASGEKGSYFAKGQMDGFDWALASIGQSLVHPVPALVMPAEWLTWKAHQAGELLDQGAWTVHLFWAPGLLAWSRKEMGFPNQRLWRPWDAPEAPHWVGLSEGAVWVETADSQAIALDPESGGILAIRPAVSHEPSREESWDTTNQDVIKEFHSPEFQRGLEALRKKAESGEVGDLLAVVDYLHGMGDEADREADGWYLKAAEKGSAKAMLHVGVSIFHGEHGPADKVAARQWMERAIQAGEPQAAAVMKLLFEGDASSQPVGAAK